MPHANWAHNTITQLSLLGRVSGQVIANVLHFEASAAEEALFVNDGVAQLSGLALATDFNTNLLASWLACHTNDYNLESIRAQVIERPANRNHKLLATDYTTGMPVAGTRAAASDDLSTAIVVRWRSLVAGRSHRGRTYIGPLIDPDVNVGIAQPGVLGVVNTWTAAMMVRYATAGGAYGNWVLTIYSRPYDAGEYQYTRRVGGSLTVITPPDYAGNSSFVVSTQTDTVVREQRRREVGVGS